MKLHPFTEFPKHLYHGTDAPRIVHNAEDEAAARAAGFGDEYVYQEYPKVVDGKLVNAPAPVAE